MTVVMLWLVIALCLGVALAQPRDAFSALGSSHVYEGLPFMRGHGRERGRGRGRPDRAVDPIPVTVTPGDITGTWYTQVFVPSCSWHGMRKAKSFVQVITEVREGYRQFDKWRLEECVSVVATLHRTRTPGVFFLKDNLGEVISGDYVFAAVERDCFHVVRGCVKRDRMTNRCQDYWVAAKTRDRHPDRRAREKITRVLNGMGYDSFDFVDQSRPC